MKVLQGKTAELLHLKMKVILYRVDAAYIKWSGEEATLTSANDGSHMFASLHYRNRAADFRLPEKNRQLVYANIISLLGPEYDVIPEVTHLHIEYDPHKPKALRNENIE